MRAPTLIWLKHLARGGGEKLFEHYKLHGRSELRGVNLHSYVHIDTVMCSEDGDIMVSGWADRGVIKNIQISVGVGYLLHHFGEIDPCWYYREDVAKFVGDGAARCGFITLLRIPKGDLSSHSDVSVFINGAGIFQNNAMRWKSVETFLLDSLSSLAPIADQPVGVSLPQATKLLDAMGDLWRRYLKGLSFIAAFENRANLQPKLSIIITLHRKHDMFLVQLEELLPALDSRVEIVIVGNDMQNPDSLILDATAFCQIHSVDLRIYLCSGNSGFSAANNFGAKRARGETLIFMNPDIFPPESAAELAFRFFRDEPGDDLHGALLYYSDGMLMHSGMYAVGELAVDIKGGTSRSVLRVEHFGKGLAHRVSDPSGKPVHVASGGDENIMLTSAALWKVRKDVFFAAGGLSEDYIFAYYEDADFCLRFLGSGRQIFVDHSSRWLHMEGVGKQLLPVVRSFMWLNRAIFSNRFAESEKVVALEDDLSFL